MTAPYRLQAGEAGELARLEARCFPDPWDEPTFVAAFARPIFAAFGLAGGDGLSAYCTVHVVLDELEIINIAVAPEFRSRGLGTKLLGFVLQHADKLGINRAYLEVRAGNLPARKLYARHGFAVVGLRKGYYADTGEDALVMVRLRAPAGAETM